MAQLGIFSDDDLTILTNINNTWHGNFAGVQFSNYKAASTPNRTNPLNDNYTGGPIAGKRYSGSVLFDTLYGCGDGNFYPYSWKTGWAGPDTRGTEGCTLFFGIIPIFWSNANNGISEDDTSVYKTGSIYDNTTKLKSFVESFFSPSEVSVIAKRIDYYKVIEGQLDKEDDNNTDSDKTASNVFEFLTVNNAIGLGVNTENHHNYKSCDFSIKNYNIINSRKDDKYKWWDIEKSGVSGYKWLPDEMSTMPRIGAIPVKSYSGENFSIDYMPAFGYYRYDNFDTLGISDTTMVTYTDPSGAVLTAPWTTYITQISNDKVNDSFFGSVNVLNSLDASLNTILSIIKDGCPISYINQNGCVCDNNANYTEKFSMLNYDTIQYNIASNTAPVKAMHVVPVFASSIKRAFEVGGGPCCFINTFQSIVYNTFYNNAILTGGFGQSDTDISAIPANERNDRTLTNQTKNTYIYYNNADEKFVMKFNSDNMTMYLSYALKVNCDTDGNPTGITAGKTIADQEDWIAWINGNIYVIPNKCFRKFVYYKPIDFITLNNIFTEE